MTNNNAITTLSGIVALVVATSLTSAAFASEDPRYKYADGLRPIVTFEFKDGMETLEFPVYIMEDDFVANAGSPGFTLQGTVDTAPHLHEALDEAFKHRQSLQIQWDYKYFDVQIDFTRDDTVVETIRYHDCKIEDYGIVTIDDDYESYAGGKSGFGVLDDIEFLCGGVNFEHRESAHYDPNLVTTFEQPSWSVSEDVRTFVEFEFDQGAERIEFPVFQIISGFEESTSRLAPEFKVEGLLMGHPLLSKAIDNARRIGGIATASNIDFEATVDFVQGGTSLRGLEFQDCRVSEYEIRTQFDKEEGWTGKRGFAVTEDIRVQCLGLEGANPRFSDNFPGGYTWQNHYLDYAAPMREHRMADNMQVRATFDFDNGREVSYFPELDQHNVLARANPTFTLTGLVGDHPLLYERVDENLDISFSTGAHNFLDMFGVGVEIIRDDAVIRAFQYADCRVLDYVVKTEEDNEGSYFKSFALTNEFDFECLGYRPLNPTHDALFEYEKPQLKSSLDYEAEQLALRQVRPLFG